MTVATRHLQFLFSLSMWLSQQGRNVVHCNSHTIWLILPCCVQCLFSFFPIIIEMPSSTESWEHVAMSNLVDMLSFYKHYNFVVLTNLLMTYLLKYMTILAQYYNNSNLTNWRASVASETLTRVTQLKIGDVCLFIYLFICICLDVRM